MKTSYKQIEEMVQKAGWKMIRREDIGEFFFTYGMSLLMNFIATVLKVDVSGCGVVAGAIV